MKRYAIYTLIMILGGLNPLLAAFSTAPGFQTMELYNTRGTSTTIGGLAWDAGKLYFGQHTAIKTLEPAQPDQVQTLGTLPSNTGIALVMHQADRTYTAFGTDYNSPFPYQMDYFDSTAGFILQWEEDGIYDYAVNSQGECYIVANPEAGGSKIFQLDLNTGGATEIAYLGGFAGGLVFDAADNLYYADQGDGARSAGVIKFTPNQVTTGGLTAADGSLVLPITAGYIGFDENGRFLATTGWGATLAEYDLTTSLKIRDIAYGSISQFVCDGASIYCVDTDWTDFASTIQRIVPEPASITLLGLAGVMLIRKKRP